MLVLWTQSELGAALVPAGFRRVDQQSHHCFGKDLVAETWQLSL